MRIFKEYLKGQSVLLGSNMKQCFFKYDILFNPLTPELNPSATRYLLGILILEPCISFIYA
jgi:hypothetical protein